MKNLDKNRVKWQILSDFLEDFRSDIRDFRFFRKGLYQAFVNSDDYFISSE